MDRGHEDLALAEEQLRPVALEQEAVLGRDDQIALEPGEDARADGDRREAAPGREPRGGRSSAPAAARIAGHHAVAVAQVLHRHETAVGCEAAAAGNEADDLLDSLEGQDRRRCRG